MQINIMEIIMKKFLLITAILVITLIIAAFANQQTEPINGDIGIEYPEEVQGNVERIVEKYGLNSDQITIISAEHVEWPNACLGLAGEDEMCAEVITPGWKIVLSSGGEVFTFHTDDTGEYIRQK
jgi:hypothetical protein